MKVSRKDSSSSIILPDDLVFQILLRLPVASLLRFKSVSKHWLRLIESPQFISQHTRRRATLEDEESKLVVLNLTGDMHCPFRHDFVSVLDLQLSTQVDFQLREESDRIEEYKLVASFDGIICLTHRVLTRYIEILGDGEEDVVMDWFTVVTLWNPATKQVKILPPPAMAAIDHYGLGFNVETNDYRVVRIIQCENGSIGAEVYSLNEDCWRPIDAVVPLNHSNEIKSGPKKPFGDRHDNYCWVGWDFISSSSFILHFNFSTEELNIVPSDEVFEDTLPPYEELECYQILGILSEKLACMNRVQNSVNYRYNIWVMDVEQMSWTKQYTLLLEPQICPIGFSVDGKMILKKIGYPRKLFLSDPASPELIDIPFQGSFSEAAVYKESLVSVKGANGETYRLDSEWEAISSTWDLIVSQTIMASSERLAPILDQDPGSLVIFDEPNTVPHYPAQTNFPPR